MAKTLVTKKFATIEGIPQLKAALAEIIDRPTAMEAKAGYFEVATTLRDRLRDATPEREGNRAMKVSKNSSQTRLPGFARQQIYASHGPEKKPYAMVGVGGNAFYLRFLEFGSRHQGAHPFYRKTVNGSKSELVAAVAEKLRAILEKKPASMGQPLT